MKRRGLSGKEIFSNFIMKGGLKCLKTNCLKIATENIEPFLDNVDRYISLWETAISLEEDISENGIRLENGKKNESVALLVSVNKQMGLMLDKLAITPELVGEANESIPEL